MLGQICHVGAIHVGACAMLGQNILRKGGEWGVKRTYFGKGKNILYNKINTTQKTSGEARLVLYPTLVAGLIIQEPEMGTDPVWSLATIFSSGFGSGFQFLGKPDPEPDSVCMVWCI